MKLAYIANDRSAHKAHGVLERHFSTIDFYLGNADSKTLNLDLERLPIVAANVCIPAEKTLRTTQHNLVMQELKFEHNKLLSHIYTRKNLQDEVLESIPLTSGNIKAISDIHFLQFNKEINKYTVETTAQQIIEYDFLIVQDNQFTMNTLLDKQRDLFIRFTEQSKVILNLDFEVKYHHEESPGPLDYIFVENILLKTIEDNWYICQARPDKFSVSVYIPLEMQNSAEYAAFLAKRIASVFNQSFEVLKIGNLIQKQTMACDGFYSHKAKLRYAKLGALVPTFTFWSQPKINNYLSLMIKSKKNKTTKNLVSEKDMS